MNIQKCIKQSFSVIGKQGTTKDGEGFIQKLRQDANLHFNEVSNLAKKDDKGNILGIWGLMSDLTGNFNPWEENFTRGMYLAGVEVEDGASPPVGWVKWTVPSYEYLYVVNEGTDTFDHVLNYLKENNIELSGAVHDFNCPETGQGYMFFPIQRL